MKEASKRLQVYFAAYMGFICLCFTAIKTIFLHYLYVIVAHVSPSVCLYACTFNVVVVYINGLLVFCFARSEIGGYHLIP
jgi:hypothetical protein